MSIPWDLESTPLQITTNSKLGSSEQILVDVFDKDGSNIAYVEVKFLSTMKYFLRYCTDEKTKLPVQPPEERNKIWTIKKTKTALIITCNNVEVLNYRFDGSSFGNDCVRRWDGDVVEEIEFSKLDDASHFYRAGISI